LSQTSDRLYSCGFPDRQSRPWSATGAGGFEVLIANRKSQFYKSQSLQEKNPTFQNLGLIFRPKNQNFPFPTCPRHTTSPIFGPPCPNFLDPLPHSLKIAPAVLLASCAWDADGEIDEEDEEEHSNTKKRQRLLLAATLRRRAADKPVSPFFYSCETTSYFL